MIQLEHILLLAVITFFNLKLNKLASFIITIFMFTAMVLFISSTTLDTVQMLIYLMFIVVNIVILLSKR